MRLQEPQGGGMGVREDSGEKAWSMPSPRMSRNRQEEVQEELPRCLRLEGLGTPIPPCPRNACSKTCFPWKLRVPAVASGLAQMHCLRSV